MAITVHRIQQDDYPRYAEIDPSFEVASVLKVIPVHKGLAGLQFVEEAVATPYRKGADSPEESPASWPPRGETGAFAAFLAMEEGFPVGGAAVTINPAGAFLLERRNALAGLFDIRVPPEYRGRGVGSQLLLHAAAWAKEQGCTQLRIECQNVNVPACRFYAKYCTLGGVERYGYAACPEVADDVMLLWYRDLW